MRNILLFFLLAIVSSTPLSARTHRDYTSLIHQAEVQATPSARRVLTVAREMVEQGVIARGACWDYLDVAFTRAGFPADQRTVLYHHRKSGPYVDLDRIRPGDWLYYINHSYGDIEHSGLFVGWIDRARHQGLILSYAGEHRHRPGRYRAYDLTHIYHITRAIQKLDTKHPSVEHTETNLTVLPDRVPHDANIT